MPEGLNYKSTHIQMSYILYFFKISKPPTLKGQHGLEGIVIKLLPGINQPHASKKNSQRTDMHRYAIFTNITNNILIMFNSSLVLENPLASDLLILFCIYGSPFFLTKMHRRISRVIYYFSLWTHCFMPGKRLITIPSNPH